MHHLAEKIRDHRTERPWLIVPGPAHRGDVVEVISYGMLREAAALIATGLVAAGSRSGDRIIVIAENSADVCQLFIGILTAGMVMVPIAPRAASERHDEWRERIERIQVECRPSLLVAPPHALQPQTLPCELPVRSVEDLLSQSRALRLPRQPDSPSGRPCTDALSSRDALALVQYTSGTLSRPRGVALSAHNIVSNVQAIGHAIEVAPTDVALCWIPLFHDMGLIGTLLFASYWGLPTVLMTPRAFLGRPESWLWNVARHRVTCCAAPNSAYQLCATRIPESKLSGLDLSSWRVACNGSELVHHATLTAFASKFSRYGFRPEAMCPLYGLAESTVATTFPSPSHHALVDWVDRLQLEQHGRAVPGASEDSSNRPIVSVGPPIEGHRVRIVRSENEQEVPERVVGDILVQGPSLMRGYFGAPVDPANLDQDRWLNTGDRGYLAEGELYLVGRSKEIVKRAGSTYDAAYVANALSTVAGIRNGAVAVFGIANEHTGTEDIVALAETKAIAGAEYAELERALYEHARQALDLRLDAVRLVNPGTIPRTTSGKVQHTKARDLYLAGALARVCGRRLATHEEVAVRLRIDPGESE